MALVSLGSPSKSLDRFFGRQYEQIDPPALRFPHDFFHHAQSTGSRIDNKSLAFPWDVLFDREWRVTEVLTVLLGWLFLTFRYLPTTVLAMMGLISTAVMIESRRLRPRQHYRSELCNATPRAA
jgi:hypothetical protein